ncbi:Zn-dependent hydrolase [Paenarthrobacter sp. Z7-10]|uniref:Zn-dependent hydrolase n=1 Tax=Paenarthrobacter sp. Z7-10 TaxID=2787635 RepID=UPI0022A99092|nr:Zn-dependent hydrolase [Paenarthrobacter sp. Z7-10]MCZ2401620.1 Zn-dependent hydrolase [Paenarthrobacter sp. Z7-10]
MTAPVLSVNAPRLIADLTDLGCIGRVEAGGINRTSFSAADTEARGWYLARCAEAGLSVRQDGVGNLIVSSPAVAAEIAARPAVWSGSHLDTVPNGGQFDGALGALAALECLRRIHEEGIELQRPVCAIMYTDEEGSYAHLLGSSALARGFSRAELEAMVGRDGDRFVDTFTAAGGDLDAAAQTRIDPGALHATVELHIEQGPTLEEQGIQIGVVSGIVGLGGGVVTFLGRADHAGTTPMSQRRDALVAAGAFVVALPEIAARISDRAVITCGMVSVRPGSANVIPESAQVSVDFRHPEQGQVEALEAAIRDTARNIAAQYGLQVGIDLEESIPPAPLDRGVQKIIAARAAARGLSSVSMPSGAGHDSQNLAPLVPTGMIFVPSIEGRSHCPEENTSWEDVENGANVLLDTLIQLAGG